VLREIEAALPAESIAYVADSANAPWGDKPPGFVRERGLKLAHFLVEQGVKAIVIASNTGTAGSAEAVRGALSVPVVGIEPGIKPAVAATKTRVIGAIVPAAVSESDRLASLLDRFGIDVKVIVQPVPGLVEFIEAADLDSPELKRKVEGYVRPMLDAGADTIVLGSTHYVFLKQVLTELAGPQVSLIETGAAVARQLGRVLGERGLLAEDGRGRERFWTSADPATSERVISRLLGRHVSVETVTRLLPNTRIGVGASRSSLVQSAWCFRAACRLGSSSVCAPTRSSREDLARGSTCARRTPGPARVDLEVDPGPGALVSAVRPATSKPVSSRGPQACGRRATSPNSSSQSRSRIRATRSAWPSIDARWRRLRGR